MPIDFPTTPLVNDLYSFAGSVWVWNGYAWKLYAGSAGEVVTSFNGLTGDVSGVSTVNGATGNITNVAKTDVSNIFSSLQTFVSGISASGSTFGSIFVSENIDIGGNINILGTLSVDGLIVTKTGFSGFTLDSDLETVEGVLLDGGEF